ncbi:hypothetical protein [uncultured Clostridium sp.]|uniref:hypothetical protein n=1 Tax=uncultured Clostridium sp. TaxID=59620 RepID=UPI0026F3AD6B|nr:hypothetical protein [uncultured Clostridium sp.]
MVKFVINIPKTNDLKKLLSIAIDEYTTVLVTRTSCYFILNSSELYMHKAFPLLTSENIEEGLSFRVNRKQLNNMLIDGFIEFLIDDEDISLNFKNKENKLKYSMTVVNQKGYDELIFRKMRLIASCQDYEMIDLNSIRRLIRVATNLGLAIGVDSGYAYAMSRTFSCFKKCNLPGFSASSKSLLMLLKFSNTVYNVQNYLIHDFEGEAVVITKHKYAPSFDIAFALKQKSSHRVELKINNILELCAKVDKSDGTFILDVEHKKAIFEKEKVKYSTPLDILDIKSARQVKKDKEDTSIEDLLDKIDLNNDAIDMSYSLHLTPKVEVPTIVLTRLIPALGLKEMATISYKKTFMQVENANTYVIFPRKEV